MNALIYGRRLQGKSTLSIALALSRKKPIVIFDTNSQYSQLSGEVSDVNTLVKLLEADHRIIRYVPEASEVHNGFSAFTDALWDWEDIVIIIDEAASVQTSGSVQPGLERLIRQAPDTVDIIQSTHRLVDTQRLTRALATDIFMFQSSLSADLDLIASEFNKQVASYVKKLPVYYCIHYWLDRGGIEKWSLWDKPGEWYVRIGRDRNSQQEPVAV